MHDRAAEALHAHLVSGGALPQATVPDLPLAPGETVHVDTRCTSARWYALDVRRPPGRVGYVEEHPVFGRRWTSNPRLHARRLHDAAAAAQLRWRDHAPTRVVLTSHGLRLRRPDWPAAWTPFDHVLLNAVRFRADRQVLVLAYKVGAPLLLAGVATRWLATAMVRSASAR